MAKQSVQPGTAQEETRLHTIDGVVVYARKDEHGKPSILDAIDQDERKIRAIADHLWRRGFGVMRQKNSRAGRILYLFKAMWTGPGEPPDDPFDDTQGDQFVRSRL
jgi:hypothetical protein